MVRSSRKVRSFVQSAGLIVGKTVGKGVDSMTTTSCVGWMIKVGSISGAWAVGGRKGVGVAAGAQADSRIERMERVPTLRAFSVNVK
jgi:hypothetical protein